MATKSKPETAQSAKPKRATTSTSTSTSPATDGKRTVGAVTRSSSNVGKTAVSSNVPSYLRPTHSTRTESPRSAAKKDTPATKPTPALTRAQSVDKSPQLQRVLFSAGPRSPALKTPTSSVASSSSPRSAPTRPTELSKSLSSTSRSRARPAELVKSNTMPKPGASSRPVSASASLSRLGSTAGKTVKKSPVAGPSSSSSKRQTTVSGDSNKQKVTAQAKPEAEPQQVVVVQDQEEKATPPPVEDESVERDVIVVEEDHVQDEHEEEEEEVVVVSTVKEDEHKELHTAEAPNIIPDIDSPPDLIDSSEEPAVEEEEEEEEEVEEEGHHHEIEFHQEEESHIIDEGEISYGEGDRESDLLQSEGRDEAEDVKPDAATTAEEENPNKETLTLNLVEEKGHNDVTVVEAAASIPPKQQSEAANVISRPVALNAQRSSVSVGKKESPAAYNDVIEETKNKLMEKRKNKVRALVGAFETVISLQE